MADEGEPGEPFVVTIDVENEKPLLYGWNRQTDAAGVICYYNIITKEVQYEVPTERARPKPRNREKDGETQLTATEIAASKPKSMYRPSAGSQRCITLCVGTPHKEHYNEEFSDFTERRSDCHSFIGSIGFNSLSIIKNGGWMW
eukprot:CAMPEP_0202718446 /NCGR_PEP_ID=MMETSP1385-20130828/122022_1 /ASSEMBLY_ACC=CAM_ASM_000861 /TAXON_ID=933848 /ORGANISM="Elphidium margaritaceum" /LENGTH=143 /DNA_ID=CAMNT_0049381165 /DNA_START=35 /DNA_END=463 /DNA_ORIENTATION=+